MSNPNVLHAVLCARIEARMRVLGVSAAPPVSEDEATAAEAELGFTFPPMLRMLYTRVANGGALLGEDWHRIAGIRTSTYQAPPSGIAGPPILRRSKDESGWRLPDAIVTALQWQPGSCVSCYLNEDEDDPNTDWSYELPGVLTFLEYEGCDVCVMLDTQTGHLYLADEGALSFCAHSVEEWLARNLDCALYLLARWYPERGGPPPLCTIHDIKRFLRGEGHLPPPHTWPYDEPAEPSITSASFWQRDLELMEQLLARMKPGNGFISSEIGLRRSHMVWADSPMTEAQWLQLHRERLHLVRRIYEAGEALANTISDEAPASAIRMPSALQVMIDADAHQFRLLFEHEPRQEDEFSIPF